MGAGFFTAAIVAALAAVAWRGLRRRRGRSARARFLAETPGYDPARPIAVSSFDELDEAVDRARCPCGGSLERLGEGSRPGVRVVRCTCPTCEEDVDLFFDLRGLRH